MTCSLQEISVGRALGDQFARAEHDDAVGHAEHRLDQVLDHDDGDAHVADALDERHRGQDLGGVEAGEQLVQQEQLGLGRQGPSQFETFAVDQGQALGLLRSARRQADDLERLDRRLLRPRPAP